DSTVRYLQDVQLPNGGFANAGQPPSQDFSAWVAFALAAAGINPRDQAQPGGVDAYSFLVEHFRQGIQEELCAPTACTTTLERELLVVDTSGTDPHSFAGIDLVGEILARKLPDGSFPFVPGGHGEVNDTIYAILSLALVKESAAQEALQSAAEWLIGQENSDRGWPWRDKGDPSEVDMTAAAIEALNAAGRHNAPSQQKALEYLHKAQEPDGGFPQFPGERESNVASTAWAVQGLWSAGENPETWMKSSGREPLDYMESLQQPDGSIQWKASSDANTLWMTAMAAPTFAGGYFPYPSVPLKEESTPTGPSTGSAATFSPRSAEPGQGGESSQPGSGVIAGGGGNGAPLFSRPQPQSKGRKPGGVRLLHGTHAHVTHKNATKQHRNPGARRQTTDLAAATPAPEPSSNHHGTGAGSAVKGVGAAASGTGLSTSTDSTKNTQGPGSASAGTGSGGSAGIRGLSTTGMSAQQAGGQEIKGVLIGAPGSTDTQNALEPGAPGLHGARAGGNQTPWLAIGIAGALLLSVLIGTQIERRRPEVIL
ncbi:MAG: prenyltransferase/squalene oxidase repeat-containing protein, partial [Solirubrobacteraceae bacterium]